MTTVERTQPDLASEARRGGPRAFVAMVALDVALPLALFYGLRLAGANQWLALVLAGAAPLVRIGLTAVRTRRLEPLSAFTLSVLAIGTAIGMLTADPRLLLARESYLTGLVGLWTMGTLLAQRPLLFDVTIRFMSEDSARAWERDWAHSPRFRRTLRIMTAAWGVAFLLDAGARVVMAYTLPVDLVPVLGTALLVVLLIVVVQATKAYGRRHLRSPEVPSEEQP
jgi:hypothetical protein